MNSKAMEMAISTLILIVIGILVLIGLTYALTGGFKSFTASSKPFMDTSKSTSIKQACSIACENNDKITFCCGNYTIDSKDIKCSDSRLEVSCGIDCKNFNCSP